MIHKSTTRVINASPTETMELLGDVTSVDKWNTHVKSVDLVSSNKQGLGAARVCNFHDGTSIKETVTKLDETHIAMDVSEFSMPLRDMAIAFAARPAAGSRNKTELTFSMHYNVKYGPLGYLLGTTLLKMKLHEVQTAILAGIDHHLATGETIGKDFQFAKQ